MVASQANFCAAGQLGPLVGSHDNAGNIAMALAKPSRFMQSWDSTSMGTCESWRRRKDVCLTPHRLCMASSCIEQPAVGCVANLYVRSRYIGEARGG